MTRKRRAPGVAPGASSESTAGRHIDTANDSGAVASDGPTEAEWVATLEAVDRGELDPDDVDFDWLPPEDRPHAAIRSSNGGWRFLG